MFDREMNINIAGKGKVKLNSLHGSGGDGKNNLTQESVVPE